jgi:hypothetical protein
MRTIWWIATLGPALLLALIVLSNWMLLIGTMWSKKSTSMVLPLIAGPMCALFFRLSPSEMLQKWFWVPLVCDYTVIGLPGLLVWMVIRRRREAENKHGPDLS